MKQTHTRSARLSVFFFLSAYAASLTESIGVRAGEAWAAPAEVSARDAFMLTFPKPEEDDLDSARELYKERCEKCHGRSMDGRGPLSEGLNPRPQDLRGDWFGRVSYAERLKLLRRVIIGGGLAVGQSALMPPNPDLRNKPKLIYALIYLIASQHMPQAQLGEDVAPAPPPQERREPPREVKRGAPPRSL
jgi:hypothetical protein